MAPASTQTFIFSRLTKSVPETPRDLVVKSNLSPHDIAIALRQLSLIHTSSEVATRGALCKKVFLEISQNSEENTCARVSFLIKLQA